MSSKRPQRQRPSQNLKALGAFSCLFIFWGLGELIVRHFNLAFPAPVVGLFFLFCIASVIKQVPRSLTTLSSRLIALLPLFLLPISVGISQYHALIFENLLAITLVIVLTTPLGLTAAALIMQKLRDKA